MQKSNVKLEDGSFIVLPDTPKGYLFPHRVDSNADLAEQSAQINTLFTRCYEKADFRSYFKSVHKFDPEWDTRLSEEKVMERSLWIRELQAERRCRK